LPVIQPGKTSVDSLVKVLLESGLYSNDDKTILVIDQLEELITQLKENERNGYIQVLKKLLETDQNICPHCRRSFSAQMGSISTCPHCNGMVTT
jgi:transcription initiation factor IIE alpha subunit